VGLLNELEQRSQNWFHFGTVRRLRRAPSDSRACFPSLTSSNARSRLAWAETSLRLKPCCRY